jgi:hypothetical protein
MPSKLSRLSRRCAVVVALVSCCFAAFPGRSFADQKQQQSMASSDTQQNGRHLQRSVKQASQLPGTVRGTSTISGTQPFAAGASCFLCASYLGDVYGSNASLPADPSIAAGGNYVMVATNANVKIFDKRSHLIQSSPLSSWAGAGAYDPSVIYDPYVARFYLIAASTTGPNPPTLLMDISASSDPTAGWTFSATNIKYNNCVVGPNCAPTTDDYCDYPHLGFDSQAVYVTCNMFLLPYGSNTFQYVKLLVINKSQFISTTGWYEWDFTNLMETTGELAFAMIPAHMHSASNSDGEYLINAHGMHVNGSAMEVWHVTNPLVCCNYGSQTAPNLSHVTVNTRAFSTPPSLPQKGLGPGYRIIPGDTRLDYAFWQAGVLSSGQQAVACGSNGSNACVTDEEFNVSQFPSVTTVNDCPFPNSDGRNRFSGGMDVNAAGSKTWVYTRLGSTDYPTAMVAQVPSGGICGKSVSETVLAAGQAAYNANLLTPSWGDFAGAASDPDGTGIWAYAEFANSSSTWSAEVGRTYE